MGESTTFLTWLYKILMINVMHILVAILFFIAGGDRATHQGPIRIMIISSYNETDPCGAEQIKGIRKKFYSVFPSESLSVKILYMRGRKINKSDSARRSVAERFYDEFKKFHPLVVFLTDDIAIDYMLPKLIRETSDYIVVFSGMNRSIYEDDSKFHFIKTWIGEKAVPSKNVTGVIEKVYIALSIRYAIKFFNIKVKNDKATGTMTVIEPDTVLILVGKDSVSQIVKRQIQRELSNFNDIPVRIEEIRTFDELLKAIKNLNNDPHIPFYYPLTLTVDSSGKTLSMTELAKYYVKYAKKPDMALNISFTMLGMFGGVGLDFEYMGEMAAKKAIEFLKGTRKMEDIYIENAARVEITLNVKRVKTLNIKIPFSKFVNVGEVVK